MTTMLEDLVSMRQCPSYRKLFNHFLLQFSVNQNAALYHFREDVRDIGMMFSQNVDTCRNSL